MSQTYSIKRSRTMSQMTDKSISNTRSFFIAPSAITKVGSKKEVAGGGVQKAQSVGAKRVLKKPSVTDLLNTMYPRTHFHSYNYGYNLYGLIMTNAVLNSKGTFKAMRCLNMTQAWFESWALPLYHAKMGSANQLDGSIPTIRSLEDLMVAAKSAVNLGRDGTLTNNVPIDGQTNQVARGNIGYQGTSNNTVPSTNPAIEDYNGLTINEPDLFDKAPFHYEGGYQRHVFKNSGNNQVFIELWELHPRNPMFDWEYQEEATLGQDCLKFKSVGDSVILDFQKNALPVTLSTLPNGMANTQVAYNEVRDPLVRISAKSHTVNSLYKVSKPIRVGLAPGETFQYTMYIPGFTFHNTEFMSYMKLLGVVGTNQVREFWTRPTSIPKFTKRLVVRAWGETGHTDVTANQISQPGSTGITGVTIMHTQEEDHKFRFMPLVNKDLTIVRYERDDNPGEANMYIMNDESDYTQLLDA